MYIIRERLPSALRDVTRRGGFPRHQRPAGAQASSRHWLSLALEHPPKPLRRRGQNGNCRIRPVQTLRRPRNAMMVDGFDWPDSCLNLRDLS